MAVEFMVEPFYFDGMTAGKALKVGGAKGFPVIADAFLLSKSGSEPLILSLAYLKLQALAFLDGLLNFQECQRPIYFNPCAFIGLMCSDNRLF